MKRRRTNGFTLIEMLVVIVIIGVLVGLAIPAVTNLMKSGGVTAALREVSNTLNLARQYAITHRTYTRVVFPYSSTGSGNHPEMWYCSYAVMTNSNNTVANGWAYLSKWEYLPPGAVFLNSIPPAGTLGALDDPNSLNWQSNLPFPDTHPGDVGQLAYIEFGPTGAATAATSGAGGVSTLALTEGFTTVSGAPATATATPTPTTTKNSSGTWVNLVTFKVDSLIGRIAVIRPS
jgi:prepilin-type N-terminal cleavage/methylation domain-containing protein